MPTYQYECVACGEAMEKIQSMTEPKLKTCPACGKDELVRLIGGGSGIIFKGSGFYETDYKRPPATQTSSEKETSGGADAPKKEASPAAAKPCGGGACACDA